jgi:hypothetical protein
MPVSISSTLVWTITNGEQQMTVPPELLKLAGGKPFLVLKPTNQKLVRLIAGGQLDDVPKANASLSANKGLQNLVDLRNLASGFIPAGTSKLMAEEDVADQAAKKARKWLFSSGSHQKPDDHHDEPELVTFNVDGYDGQITAIKAYHARETLILALDDAVLNIVFSLMIDSGLDLTPIKKKET